MVYVFCFSSLCTSLSLIPRGNTHASDHSSNLFNNHLLFTSKDGFETDVTEEAVRYWQFEVSAGYILTYTAWYHMLELWARTGLHFVVPAAVVGEPKGPAI